MMGPKLKPNSTEHPTLHDAIIIKVHKKKLMPKHMCVAVCVAVCVAMLKWAQKLNWQNRHRINTQPEVLFHSVIRHMYILGFRLLRSYIPAASIHPYIVCGVQHFIWIVVDNVLVLPTHPSALRISIQTYRIHRCWANTTTTTKSMQCKHMKMSYLLKIQIDRESTQNSHRIICLLAGKYQISHFRTKLIRRKYTLLGTADRATMVMLLLKLYSFHVCFIPWSLAIECWYRNNVHRLYLESGSWHQISLLIFRQYRINIF